jgi:hypothetical protein
MNKRRWEWSQRAGHEHAAARDGEDDPEPDRKRGDRDRARRQRSRRIPYEDDHQGCQVGACEQCSNEIKHVSLRSRRATWACVCYPTPGMYVVTNLPQATATPPRPDVDR